MTLPVRIVPVNIPPYLEDIVGKERLARCLTLLKQEHTIKNLLAGAGQDRNVMRLVLEKMIEAGAVVADTNDISKETLLTELISAKSDASPILLVTDSAADIPAELRKEKGIASIPLSVSIDGKQYLDGIEISSEEFYNALPGAQSFPVTRPPSQNDFHSLFEENIGKKDILGIFISKAMSETCDIATRTKMNNYNSYVKKRLANPEMPKKVTMEFVDSRLVSMGAGLLVLEAADRINDGWPIDKIRRHIDGLIDQVRVIFMVDSLDYLVRGGRIGRGSAMVGKLFGLKPILGMAGGGVNARSRAFGGRRAKQKLIKFMKEDLGDTSRPLRVGVCHANALAKAEGIREAVAEEFSKSEQMISCFGPTVGAHTGPGAVGVAWLPHTVS